MKTITVREARDEMARLEEILAREGEVVLTRRGRPIARILPVHGRRAIASRASLRQQTPRVRRPSEDLIRADRDDR